MIIIDRHSHGPFDTRLVTVAGKDDNAHLRNGTKLRACSDVNPGGSNISLIGRITNLVSINEYSRFIRKTTLNNTCVRYIVDY